MALRKKLRQLKFEDGGDRLVLRIAIVTADRTIVTSDPDFWDPANKASVGNSNAPVARILKDDEEIRVMTLEALLKSIKMQ